MRGKSSSETWTVGGELPSLSKSLTQEKIDGYARASGDFNPIHVDAAFAAATPFGGTIGRAWLSGGRLKVRFKGVARPGDTLTMRGRVERGQDEGRRLFAAVECVNQAGELLVTGDAEVRLDG
jgi:acyl dehydratase